MDTTLSIVKERRHCFEGRMLFKGANHMSDNSLELYDIEVELTLLKLEEGRRKSEIVSG
jgi:hypothetical protein